VRLIATQFRLALALLAVGAVINVAVAWGLIIWSDAGRAQDWNRYIADGIRCRTSISPDLLPLVLAREPRRPALVYERRASGFGLLARSSLVVDASVPDRRDWGPEVQSYSAGWPFLSLTCRRWVLRPYSPDAQEQPWLYSIPRPRRPGSPYLVRFSWVPRPPLPLLPRAAGSAGNTAFYAVLIFALTCGPSRLRGALRRRRGACRACGYDRTGVPETAPCPECGQPAP
jgi:hypothetical protein